MTSMWLKVRGSDRLTLRNRKYLRRVEGQRPPWRQIVPYVAEHRNEIGEEKQVDTSHEVIPRETQDQQQEPENARTEASHSMSNEVTQGIEGAMSEADRHIEHQTCSHATGGPRDAEGSAPATRLNVTPEGIVEVSGARPKRVRLVPKWHKDYDVGGLLDESVGSRCLGSTDRTSLDIMFSF